MPEGVAVLTDLSDDGLVTQTFALVTPAFSIIPSFGCAQPT
jgi:hypothetical protein